MAAAQEEKQIATRKGHLLDGIPFITVVGDGGWSKRSYGHTYSASSGVVSITLFLSQSCCSLYIIWCAFHTILFHVVSINLYWRMLLVKYILST